MTRRTDRLTLSEAQAQVQAQVQAQFQAQVHAQAQARMQTRATGAASFSPASSASSSSPPALTGRPWVAIRWRCCSVYTRVYRHPDSNRYRGACPRCGQNVTIQVAPGGKDARFFEAG